MHKVLKRIKELLSKGFASADEKQKLAADFAALKAEEQEALQDEAGKVKDLPEEDPASADDDAEVEKSIKALFEKEASNIEKSLESKVIKFLEEHKELKAKSAGVYHPEVQEKRKEMSSRMREITKALANNNDVKLKELTTDATGTPYGGYIVDSELSAEIRHLTTEYGVARREMTSLPLSKDSYKANNLVTDVTVYWVDEAAAISSTQAVLGQVSLELKKLGAIVTFTSELLENEEIDFVSFIASRVAEGFAQAEDEAFFKGDGTSTYGSFTGLLNNTSVNEVTMTGTTFASIDADDLLDMQDATPQGAQQNAKYFAHRTIMSLVRKLKATDNSYIYQEPSATGPATIWGKPYVPVEAMPAKTDTAADTSFVLYGDMKKTAIHGFKASGLRVSRFDAGIVRNVAGSGDINLITTDREAVRWTEGTGYVVVVPTAMTKLTTAAASA